MMDDRIGNQPDGSQILARLTLSFQDFVDAIPAGAVVVDEQGVILITNAELDRQFGYESGGLLDQPVEMLVPVAACAVAVPVCGPNLADLPKLERWEEVDPCRANGRTVRPFRSRWG